ncbi:MAG: isoleucine--tRNA ligase [Methanoregulaceae archaeon]
MKEVTSSYNAQQLEEEVQSSWRTEGTYAKVKTLHAHDPAFFFVDGPPYTTGNIHLGTAWNKIIKDSILRYHRMNGRNVVERAGYDMHGLPIEVKVEQQMGFASKKDIENFGIGKFITACREFAEENKLLMDQQFEKLGIWLDFPNAYRTVTPDYIEAAWWTLAQAEKNGKLERGHRVVNWCPRCGTAIADAEVEYWDEKDPSIFVKFPVAGKEGEYLVIWTTTPWTLPANVAVAVGADFTYAQVKAVKDGKEEVLWIAEDLVEPVLKKGRYQDFTVIGRKAGKELVGTKYESPLASDVPLQKEIAHRVVTADFVAMENTGMVHIAPGHGWDDYLLGVRENLVIVCPVDGAGNFTEEAGKFAGKNVKEANGDVLIALGHHLLGKATVTHRYGHCWRCKTPIIFRATSQWFLKVKEIRDQMLDEVAKVTWYPDWAGSARFYDWIKEARDWCISRQRYWGIPIPIWVCPACNKYRVIGTIRELEEASGTRVPDPHRPYVDEISIPCSCGGTMKRVGDIFDVWFDSGVASWATVGFPGKKEAFEQLWPADFITEGQDQTRGWFYSQLGASTIAFGKAPYKSVLMHGFALDAEGRKMSKSLGNVVAPEEVVQKAGVDVLRLYVLSSSAPWDDLKFNWEGVKTVSRTVNILWNVYRFPLPYMILDGFEPKSSGSRWNAEFITGNYRDLPEEDRWIVSRVNTLAETVVAELKGCNLHRATRAILSFILEDLSRWYIQLVRPRMWLEGDSPEKVQAYETMYYVLRRLTSILAPFAPHITEKMYANLRLAKDPGSVHMLAWPVPAPTLTDKHLEEEMAAVQSFDEASANARQAGKRKLRWPVASCVVATGSPAIKNALLRLNAVCRDRANSREVKIIDGAWDRIGWKAEPVMKALGPGFGKDSPKVKAAIESADGTALKYAIETAGKGTVESGGQQFGITSAHVTFSEQAPEGIFSAPMKDATVYVDVTLSPDLEAEGYAREVIRRIQEMRRQLDLKVEDFIAANVAVADTRVCDLIKITWKDGIAEEVRAKDLSIRSSADEGPARSWQMSQDWDVEGIAITIAISKA